MPVESLGISKNNGVDQPHSALSLAASGGAMHPFPGRYTGSDKSHDHAMQYIAALGPENTFSEMAAKAYIEHRGLDLELKLFPTIKKAFLAVGKECACGILPIENMVDGYVQPVLDLLLDGGLFITDEILLPIHFSFVANCEKPGQVKRIFSQFVSAGQCSEFVEGLENAETVTTESNGASLRHVLEGRSGEGAVVPFHILKKHSFPLVVENINDYPDNQTRFIVIGTRKAKCLTGPDYKTSIVIKEGTDRPGLLSDILAAFAGRGVNLVTIMSRPTKELLGKYHFFVDIEGCCESPAIRDALTEISQCGEVKLLGSYPRVGTRETSALSPAFSDQTPRLPASPFSRPGARPKVSVAGGGGPYRNTRDALSRLDLSPAKGLRVLLKPNSGRMARAGSGIVTHPEVVAAAIDAFVEAGAKVAVGESPIIGVKALEAFEESGIAAVAAKRGCPLIDLDERRPAELQIPGGRAITKLKLCADILEFDAIVSIPVMKRHMHTVVTLSVKNMKGCLWRRSKVDLHMLPPVSGCDDKSLDVAIADMASVLAPHFAIIDGTVGMEGLGPSAGEAKPFDVVVASSDPFAADAVACRLMGAEPSEVPHLRISAERGLGSIDTGRMDILPAKWISLASPFAPVPRSISIKFPGVTVLDSKSCSACQSTVLMFLQRYGKDLSGYFDKGKKVTVAIGKGHTSVPAGALCIGNCTRIHEERGIFVAGCPPVASEILECIKKKRMKGKKKAEGGK